MAHYRREQRSQTAAAPRVKKEKRARIRKIDPPEQIRSTRQVQDSETPAERLRRDPWETERYGELALDDARPYPLIVPKVKKLQNAAHKDDQQDEQTNWAQRGIDFIKKHQGEDLVESDMQLVFQYLRGKFSHHSPKAIGSPHDTFRCLPQLSGHVNTEALRYHCKSVLSSSSHFCTSEPVAAGIFPRI
jgi:hypothetical protein